MNKNDVRKLYAGSVISWKGVPRVVAATPSPSYIKASSVDVYLYTLDGSSTGFECIALSEIDTNVPQADSDAVKTRFLPMLASLVYPTNGTDPEIFVTDKAGVIIPAWKFLKSNEETKKINYGSDVFSYWDGFQAEISTRNGFSCHETMTNTIQQGLAQIHAAAITYDKDAKFLAADAAKVDRKDLITADDHHVMFGCAPSENIYGIEKIDILNPREVPYRFSGTHFHYTLNNFGRTPPAWWPHGVVAMIDKIGGLVLTALGRDAEDPIRRKFYGRPGEYRSKTNAHLEYRTPGSFLMRHPALYIFGADICRFGFKMGMQMDGRVFDAIPDVKDIILNCDADAASDIIKQNASLFKTIFAKMYGNSIDDMTLALLTDKRRKATAHIKTIEEEWNVTIHGVLPPNYRWRNTVQML